MIDEPLQTAAFSPSPGLADQIADHVQNQIIRGELAAGDKVSEASITKELGVSRGPVRESLRVLWRRHLVTLLPRKGASVSEFGPDDVHALYDLQESLMQLLVRKATLKWQPEDLGRFRLLHEELENTAKDADALTVLKHSFTFQVVACELVGNTYLTSAFVDLQPSFSRAYYRALASGRDELVRLGDFIGRLIQAIAEGKSRVFEDLIASYCLHQKELVLSTFDG